jgi:hypothetical protein
MDDTEHCATRPSLSHGLYEVIRHIMSHGGDALSQGSSTTSLGDYECHGNLIILCWLMMGQDPIPLCQRQWGCLIAASFDN